MWLQLAQSRGTIDNVIFFINQSPTQNTHDSSERLSHDQQLFVINHWSSYVLTAVIERGLVFSTANFELGEGMLLCSSFSHISIWISGTRFISSVFSSSTTSLVSTSPSRTAPITLAATVILSFFLYFIHSITDLFEDECLGWSIKVISAEKSQ